MRDNQTILKKSRVRQSNKNVHSSKISAIGRENACSIHFVRLQCIDYLLGYLFYPPPPPKKKRVKA